MGYIYKVTNDINNNVYIGKTTTSLEKRWKRHIYDSYRTDRTTSKFHNAIKKYGENHFKIELIGRYDNDILNEKEKFYIKLYDSYKNGYNSTLGGDGNLILDISHNDVMEKYNNGQSILSISKDFSVSISTISNIINEHQDQIIDNITRLVCITKNFNEITAFGNILDAYKWYSREKKCTYNNFKFCVKKAYKNKNIAFNYYWLTEEEYVSILNKNIDLNDIFVKRKVVPKNRIRLKCVDLNIVFNSCYEAGEYLFEHGYSKNKNFKSAGQKIVNAIKNNKTVYKMRFEFDC